MATKCLHKGCGKLFTDASEPCTYHPGPPEFHEGTKGWKCCKPRVLTFDEFLSIPPCTTGTHSAVDDTPAPAPKPAAEDAAVPTTTPLPHPQAPPAAPRAPQASAPAAAPEPEPESEADDPAIPVPAQATCRRRGCGAVASSAASGSGGDRGGETCVFHPGRPVFHEGNKGWSCCRKRVLDFDEFMGIEGCEKAERHLFVGSGRKIGKGAGGAGGGAAGAGGERVLEAGSVRHDFYQTPSTVHASLFLKKIVKERATVVFGPESVEVDLPTAEATRYRDVIPLFGTIDVEKSAFRVLGTKLELTLAKADGRGWSVLRADDRPTGEIIQSGKAGRA